MTFLTFADKRVKYTNLEVSITRKLRKDIPWFRIPPAKYLVLVLVAFNRFLFCVFKGNSEVVVWLDLPAIHSACGGPPGRVSFLGVDSLLCPFQV